jgi:hypothetical protein
MKIAVKAGVEHYEIIGLNPGQGVQITAINSAGSSAPAHYTAPAATEAPDAPALSD